MSMGKGVMKSAFERAMKIPLDRREVGPDGCYVHELTQVLWLAFKAGMAYTPAKGSFVVAFLNEEQRPTFVQTPTVYDFKDEAKIAARTQALHTDTVCVVYQQVSAFNPANH